MCSLLSVPGVSIHDVSDRGVSAHGRTPVTRDQRMERVDVDGLDKMAVESGFGRAPPVVGLSVTGQRNQETVARLRKLAQLACDLVAIHAREADVEQYDLGCVLGGQRE